jgi:hypothetical protein
MSQLRKSSSAASDLLNRCQPMIYASGSARTTDMRLLHLSHGCEPAGTPRVEDWLAEKSASTLPAIQRKCPSRDRERPCRRQSITSSSSAALREN